MLFVRAFFERQVGRVGCSFGEEGVDVADYSVELHVGQGDIPDDRQYLQEVRGLGQGESGEIYGLGLDHHAGVGAGVQAPGGESAPSKVVVCLAVENEGFCSSRCGFEDEMQLVVWSPSGEVGMPAPGNAVLAGLAIWGGAWMGSAAVVMGGRPHKVVAGDDRGDSFSRWTPFQGQSDASGIVGRVA